MTRGGNIAHSGRPHGSIIQAPPIECILQGPPGRLRTIAVLDDDGKAVVAGDDADARNGHDR
jgi:hypothetical protein